MNTNEDKLERIKSYISRKIAVYQERNEDNQKTYFENKKTNECEVYFEWKNVEKLGFGSDSSELYDFLCEMKQDGLIIDIKRKNPGYFWIIKKESFFITEERIKDRKKGYYFIRNGKHYWEKDGEKVGYDEVTPCDSYSGDFCYGDVILDTPPPTIMILVDGNFKKNLHNQDQHNQNSRIKINIDLGKEGIYRLKDNKKLSYNISGGRESLIRALRSGKKTGKILMQKCGYTNLSWLSGEVKDINDLFKRHLQVEDKLIMNHDRAGYYLNRETYDIEFK